ncbi:MAG: tripartite tricarboxylate transporter TctB family protein [Deltaproteobacteria bacterium]|nr:tripartite tricarboxylate transporter TctB family protein [Deltaproteobacteria bacterium]
MRRIALYCNLFWILFSLVVCVEAYRLRLGTITKPGSGLFPFSLGVVMLVLSLSALFQAIGRKTKDEKRTPQEPFRWWSIVFIVAATLAFALTLEKIGFLIDTFLFICLLLKVVEPQTWKTSIIGGLTTAVVANVVFNVIFKAQLPSGMLGF